jgi:hypothetical protein
MLLLVVEHLRLTFLSTATFLALPLRLVVAGVTNRSI